MRWRHKYTLKRHLISRLRKRKKLQLFYVTFELAELDSLKGYNFSVFLFKSIQIYSLLNRVELGDWRGYGLLKALTVINLKPIKQFLWSHSCQWTLATRWERMREIGIEPFELSAKVQSRRFHEKTFSETTLLSNPPPSPQKSRKCLCVIKSSSFVVFKNSKNSDRVSKKQHKIGGMKYKKKYFS